MSDQAMVGRCPCGCGVIRAASVVGTVDQNRRAKKHAAQWKRDGLRVGFATVEEVRTGMGACRRADAAKASA